MAVDIQRYFQSYRSATWLAVSDPVPQEAPIEQAEIQPTGWVMNSTANVVVDEEGLHIFDGAIFMQDYTGEQVLTASGFGGPWSRYAASGNIYNNDFRTAVLGPVAESLIGDAATTEDYENSISTQVPYWVIESVGDGITVVPDPQSPSGKALEFTTLNPATSARIFQDIPVAPRSSHVADLIIKDIGPLGSEGGGRWRIFTEWRDADHALIGVPADASYGHYSEGDTTFTRHSIMVGNISGRVEAPTNAAYLRLKIHLQEFYLGNSTRLGSVEISDANPVTVRLRLHNDSGDDSMRVAELANKDGYATFYTDSGVRIQGILISAPEFAVRVDGDTNSRTQIGVISRPPNRYSGIALGSGSVPADVFLERTSAGMLVLTGALRGTETWQDGPMVNGWGDYGAPYNGIEYRKDLLGYVHLRGLTQGGLVGLGIPLMTLPVGYRPGVTMLFVIMQNNAVGRVDITANGVVSVDSTVNASNAWVSLNGISFFAEN